MRLHCRYRSKAKLFKLNRKSTDITSSIYGITLKCGKANTFITGNIMPRPHPQGGEGSLVPRGEPGNEARERVW